MTSRKLAIMCYGFDRPHIRFVNIEMEEDSGLDESEQMERAIIEIGYSLNDIHWMSGDEIEVLYGYEG